MVIQIDGVQQDNLLRRLISLKHTRRTKKPSHVTFRFRNDDKTLASDPRFFSNVMWKFRWGFLNDMSEVFSYVSRGLEPKYADKKEISITLFDQSSNMAKHSSAKNWGKVHSSDVAKQLAEKYGFESQIVPSDDKKAHVQPGNLSDLRYLQDLASNIGYEMFVAGSPPTLYYRPRPYEAAASNTFIFEEDPGDLSYVLSFNPSIKSLGAENNSASKTKAGEGSKDKGSGKDGNTDFSVVRIVREGEGVRKEVVEKKPPGIGTGVNSAVSSTGDAKKAAAAAKQNQLDRANKANSSHPMTPSLVPGNTYIWGGLESKLNGKWLCSEATTEISGTTLRTNAQWSRDNDGKNKGKDKKKDKKDGTGDGVPVVVFDPDAKTYKVIHRASADAGRAHK